MTYPSTEQRLRRIVAQVAHVSPDAFALDDELAIELGLDSLSLLRIVAGVEREFGIIVEDEPLRELVTLRAMLAYLEKAARADPDHGSRITSRAAANRIRPAPRSRGKGGGQE